MRAIFLLCSVPTTLAFWRNYHGYIPAGGDVATLPPGTTVAVAKAACSANSACVAFTYTGTFDGPSTGTVYLKNQTAFTDFMENQTSEWTTYAQAIGPCDILLAAGTPCVNAVSVVRALYSAYTGPIYQVNRTSDSALLNISTINGFADAASQDAFCAGVKCIIQVIFDQSPQGNDLQIAPPGGAHNQKDAGVVADRFPVTISGQKVYAAYFENGNGYRIDNTTGVARGNDPETIYMVTSGEHVNGGCCEFLFLLGGGFQYNRLSSLSNSSPLPPTFFSRFFPILKGFDFGNAESNNLDDGQGKNDAFNIYLLPC